MRQSLRIRKPDFYIRRFVFDEVTGISGEDKKIPGSASAEAGMFMITRRK